MSSAALRRRRAGVLAFAQGLALIAPARAHAPSTGLGPVADGMAWLLETPTDLLLAAALVLLQHQHQQPSPSPRPVGSLRLSWPLSLFWPLAWTAGALCAQALLPALWVAPLLSAVSMAIALMVALGLQLPPGWLIALQQSTALGFGMVRGSLLSGHSGAAPLLLVAGGMLLGWIALLRFALIFVRGSWGAIAVRVGGSWIAAASLLMLGWQLRHPQ